MSRSSRKKKEGIFCIVCFVRRNFFYHVFYLNDSVLNTLSEYTYFHKSKNITSYTFFLVFKIVQLQIAAPKFDSGADYMEIFSPGWKFQHG